MPLYVNWYALYRHQNFIAYIIVHQTAPAVTCSTRWRHWSGSTTWHNQSWL